MDWWAGQEGGQPREFEAMNEVDTTPGVALFAQSPGVTVLAIPSGDWMDLAQMDVCIVRRNPGCPSFTAIIVFEDTSGRFFFDSFQVEESLPSLNYIYIYSEDPFATARLAANLKSYRALGAHVQVVPERQEAHRPFEDIYRCYDEYAVMNFISNAPYFYPSVSQLCALVERDEWYAAVLDPDNAPTPWSADIRDLILLTLKYMAVYSLHFTGGVAPSSPPLDQVFRVGDRVFDSGDKRVVRDGDVTDLGRSVKGLAVGESAGLL
jgi:hypothetical protein